MREVVIGVLALLGIIVAVVRKNSITDFNEVIDSSGNKQPNCTYHPNILERLKVLDSRVSRLEEVCNEHNEAFADERGELKEIREELKSISSSIAVLMDRSNREYGVPSHGRGKS